jgi:hypothetical protein
MHLYVLGCLQSSAKVIDPVRVTPTRLPLAKITGAKFVSTIGSIPKFLLGSSKGSDQPFIAVGSLVQVMYVGSVTFQSRPRASQSGAQSMLELPSVQSVQVAQTVGVRCIWTVVV